jgi:hypothetical protein
MSGPKQELERSFGGFLKSLYIFERSGMSFKLSTSFQRCMTFASLGAFASFERLEKIPKMRPRFC